MTFWGGERLRIEGKKKGIVQPFDERQIDCSAYTLTLGAEVYVTPSHGDDLRQSQKSKLDPHEWEEIDGHKLKKGGGSVVLPPGQFAFLLTEEIVSIPNNAMGFISLKSSVKFKGLINVSGFHVDPGFRGRLIYSVFNGGPSAIQLARGDQLFLLWIASLSGVVVDKFTKTKPGYVEIPSTLVTDGLKENHSLQALSEKVSKIDEQFRIIRNVAGGVAGALALLLTLWGLKQIIWSDDTPASAQPQTTPTIVIEHGQPSGPVPIAPQPTDTPSQPTPNRT